MRMTESQSRYVWRTIAGLVAALAHTIIMREIPVWADSDIIPPVMFWAMFDFPVSWFVLPFVRDSNVPLLIAGGLQWCLWGFLLSRYLHLPKVHSYPPT